MVGSAQLLRVGRLVLDLQEKNNSSITFNFSSAIFLSNAASILDYALQPVIDMHTGELAGVEALLRNVDQMGFEHPGAVFDAAHELNCLSNLETILRRKAIEKFASSEVLRKTKLFLNIDARLASETDCLFEDTVALLQEHGLQPNCVMLELSERQDISTTNNFDGFIETARDHDFGLAVDDFGQGFAQMKSLYDFDPHILKIDRFFITAIQSDSRKRLLVSSLVRMAHTLGVRIVAEGIETIAEFEICKQIGCDLAQGFYVARPTTHVPDIQQSYAHRLTVDHEKTGDSSRETIIRKEVRPIVALRDDAATEDVLDRFRGSRTNPMIPIVNAFNEPRGIIKEADIKQLVYMPFGQDLLRNKAVNRDLKNFIHRCPVADINSTIDQLIGMIANEEDETDGILITRNGRYYGFLTTGALLKLANEVRMRAAEDLNPLTKLPGNNSVKSFVVTAAHDADLHRSFCYIDFDNFKPFNDSYGFQTGDRAILLFSELAKKFGADHGCEFLGHVGGDDFFMGFRGKSSEKVQTALIALVREFRHQAESFYDPEHREAGFIRSKDRSGEMRDFPLLTCSSAVLHLPQGVSVDNQDILWRQIATLKQNVKNEKCGLLSMTFGDNSTQRAA